MKESEYITIEEALKKGTGNVNLRGWVYRQRASNKFVFIVLRDESDIIQCVIPKNKNPEIFEKAEKLTIESSVKISGELKEDVRAPNGYEVSVSEMEIIQIADPFPITEHQSPELLYDNRHLWIRSRKLNAVLKIRHTIVGAIHNFFRDRGYYEFDAPIFQPSQSEGGATLFEVKYFDDIMYLRAGIFSLGKIYNMGPTFRAEKSKTSRHLAEFWMAEMEAAWMTLDGAVKVAKDEIRFIVQEVLKHNKKELEILERDIKLLEHYAEAEYPTIKFRGVKI